MTTEFETIDIDLDAITGGDAFGTHLGDIAGRVANGALGNGMPDWMKLSDAGKIDERKGILKNVISPYAPQSDNKPIRR